MGPNPNRKKMSAVKKYYRYSTVSRVAGRRRCHRGVVVVASHSHVVEGAPTALEAEHFTPGRLGSFQGTGQVSDITHYHPFRRCKAGIVDRGGVPGDHPGYGTQSSPELSRELPVAGGLVSCWES